jgi:hypothetical protein
MKRPDWTGLAIVILALAVGIGWAGTMILVAGPRTPPISEAQGQLLSAIGGGLVVILAQAITQQGVRRRPRDDDDEDE